MSLNSGQLFMSDDRLVKDDTRHLEKRIEELEVKNVSLTGKVMILEDKLSKLLSKGSPR